MTISPVRYRAITIASVVGIAVLVVAGAAVRLTDSGLGCDDWPNCSETRFIDVSSRHAAIEQLNRLLSGVIGVAVVVAALGAYLRQGERRPDLVRIAWLVVAGTIANAVLGGIAVRVDLHPLAVQGHLILALLVIVAGTVLVRRAGEPDGGSRLPTTTEPARRLTWLIAALTSVAVFTGTLVTGAGPHAGDENASRLELDIGAVARVHGIAVMAAIAAVLVLARRTRTITGDRSLTPAVSTWLFVGVLQAVIGYVQYFNDVPALLVGIHVAGATLVTWATTQLVLDTSEVVGDHSVVAVPPREFSGGSAAR